MLGLPAHNRSEKKEEVTGLLAQLVLRNCFGAKGWVFQDVGCKTGSRRIILSPQPREG